MREIEHHKGDTGPNELFTVMAATYQVGDKKREAPVYYEVYAKQNGVQYLLTKVRFQDGPLLEHLPEGEVKVNTPNGLTNEVLLSMIIDRLLRYQQGDYVGGIRVLEEDQASPVGKFACGENAEALTHLQAALSALQCRTAKRIGRGVEGTKTP